MKSFQEMLADAENASKSLQAENTDLKSRLNSINNIIYAEGAPLGSDRYFKIRELAARSPAQKPGDA